MQVGELTPSSKPSLAADDPVVGGRGQQSGFTLVAAMVTLAIVMTGLAVAGPVWTQSVRRDRERELIRIGTLYVLALSEYRENSPGTEKRFPKDLKDLTQDPRTMRLKRYIRRLYVDPVAAGHPWGLIRDAKGGIQGIYSLSDQAPLAQGPQRAGPVLLKPSQRYSEWLFKVPDKQ